MRVKIALYLRPYLKQYYIFQTTLQSCPTDTINLNSPSTTNSYILNKLLSKREFLQYKTISNIREGREKIYLDIEKDILANSYYKSFLPDVATHQVEQFLRLSILNDLYMAVAVFRDSAAPGERMSKEFIIRHYLEQVGIDESMIDYADLRRALNRHTKIKEQPKRNFFKESIERVDVKKEIQICLFER